MRGWFSTEMQIGQGKEKVLEKLQGLNKKIGELLAQLSS